MSESSSESDVKWCDLKNDLFRRISEVQSTGSFVTSGRFSEFPLPAICVEDIGTVAVPLSTQDAQSLIKGSRKAPFGKGDQTVVDENIRKTWEIQGSRVVFMNEAWNGWLDNLVVEVAEKLGVVSPDSVRAELHKMLLYEKGSMFKPHRDTEKVPGMFGTLVICLPSKHVGGAMKVTHGELQQTISTETVSDFNISYLAFYADVRHEVLNIQTGYRWVLTYNLIKCSPSFPESAAEFNIRNTQFCQSLQAWDRPDEGGPQALCYALEHQYTNASMKLGNLKRIDYHRARFVAECCEKSERFNVFFSCMKRSVSYYEECEDDASDVINLDHIVDKTGFQFASSLEIPESFLMQNWLYDSRHPDENTGGEYLGNQNAEIEQIHNDTVMILVPKSSTPRFLLGKSYNAFDLKNFLQVLQNRFITKNKDPFTRELILRTCEEPLNIPGEASEHKDSCFGPAAVAAVIVGDESVFNRVVKSLKYAFDSPTSTALAELVSLKKPGWLRRGLVEAYRKPSIFKVRQSLQAFGVAYKRVHLQETDKQHATIVNNWIRDRLLEALNSASIIYKGDTAALISISKEYDDRRLDNTVKAFINRFLTVSEFVNDLAIELLSFSYSKEVEESQNKETFTRLLFLVQDAAVTQFQLQHYSSHSKNKHTHHYPYSSWPQTYNDTIESQNDARNVVSLYQRVAQSDQMMASSLLSKIQEQTGAIVQSELYRLIIPFLGQMLGVLDTSLAATSQFFRLMMITCTVRVVREEPEKPKDWARPDEARDRYCYQSDCRDCQLVNDFMIDPTEQSRRFESFKDPSHLRWKTIGKCTISDSSCNPIVTKTTKTWEEAHAAWEKRASEAQKTFQRLPQTKLKECLGESYEGIMDLRVVKIQDKPSLDAQFNDTAIEHKASDDMATNRIQKRSRTASPLKRKRNGS